jgi:16S rRNA (cytidine1402-2'-O)-methyltransferase
MVLLLEAGPLATDAPRTQTLAARVAALMNEQVPEMDALKRAAREHGLSKSEAYREWQRAKK